jgi:large subunit ribosomal protein L27
MSTFKLDLQFFAQKKAGGSANTNRSHDSHSKRRGKKCDDGEIVKKGAILFLQLGTKIHPGEGVKAGKN